MPEPVYPPLEMPPTVERRKVTIWSNGVALDGDVYRPRQVAPDAELPAVVLCHGWGGSKLTGERYAALFADAGMITLTFTQATWFGSGARVHLIGPPPERDALGQAAAKVRLIRDQVDPVDWIQNFHAAIDFIEGEPNVDPGRIGAWGTSFGGGVAIHAAANDARIKVLSVQVTAVVPLSDRALARARQRAIEIARGAIDPIPEGLDARPGLAGSPNLAKSARYNVLGELDRLHIPTNMIDAGDEEMFAIAENCGRAFEQLRGRPGQIVNYQVIPGINHYGIYFEGYDASSRSALAWFERHL